MKLRLGQRHGIVLSNFRYIFTVNFSGHVQQSISSVCLSVCLCLPTITLEFSDL